MPTERFAWRAGEIPGTAGARRRLAGGPRGAAPVGRRRLGGSIDLRRVVPVPGESERGRNDPPVP
jgi:hypothetical protein